ncbi:MAG: hypothetical protein M3R61_10395, partial [Chloroflexota bacterium]|nr:hypothetical protein [Chloroflexota bacterium]
HQTAEAARILHDHPAPPVGSDTLVVRVDGAMVPLVGGPWKAVRTRAGGAVQPPVAGPDGAVIRPTTVAYFSRLSASSAVAELAVPAVQRRGMATARRVGVVGAGARWGQSCSAAHVYQPKIASVTSNRS